MGTLKSSDILGEIKGEAPTIVKDETSQKRDQAKQAGANKPSPYETDLRARVRDKIQFNIGQIPRFIADEFDKLLAESSCKNKREFFYKLLRDQGAKIPAYKDLDGRKM